LHIAAFNGHYLIVKYLLEQGANPIIANREGLTPLNFAEKSKVIEPLGSAKKVKRAGSAA